MSRKILSHKVAKINIIFSGLFKVLSALLLFISQSNALSVSECKNALDGLTPDEIQSVQEYTGNGYFEPINFYLRTGKLKSGYSKAEIQKTIEDLKSALNKRPDFHGQVYRFISIGAHQKSMPKRFPWYEGTVIDLEELATFLNKHKPGKVFSDAGFMSTTSNQIPSGKFDFTSMQYKIRSYHGKSVGEISQYSAESEVMFEPDHKFKVSKIEGKFVHFWGSDASQYPDLPEWIKYVHHFQKYFPNVTEADIQKKFAKQMIPNLIVVLDESVGL